MKPADKEHIEKQFNSKIWEASGNYSNNFRPDVDLAWNSFKQKMETQEPEAIRRSIRKIWLARVAAAAVLLLSTWFAWQYISPNSTAVNYLTFSTEVGATDQVSLSDGSTVFLGEGSMIRYPETFSGDVRDLQLSGRAFFEINPDPDRPFIIQTNSGQVEVLGTSFLVRSFASEKIEEVLVKTGRVAYTPKGTEPYILEVGDKLTYQSEAQEILVEKVNQFNDIAWVTGDFKLRNTPFGEVLESLVKNYGITLDQNQMGPILDCKISLTLTSFPSEEEILRSICAANGAQLLEKGAGSYAIIGGVCPQ